MEFLHTHQSIRNEIFSTLDILKAALKSVSLDAVQSHVMLSRRTTKAVLDLYNEITKAWVKKELMTRTAHNNSQTISLLEHRSLEPKYNVRTVQKKTYPGPGGQGGS